MEHPHDPYHVRPFPKQPQRGGKELVVALKDLEETLSETVPDLERLRIIQEQIHKTTNQFTDDRLVDLIRQISKGMDEYQKNPSLESMEKILQNVLKARFELKHL